MDFEDYPVRYSSLDSRWFYAARPGIQAKGIRKSQASMGDSNTVNSLLRLTSILAFPPQNPES